MLKTAILGYPRIGENRELKKALEAYWKGEISGEALERAGAEIRKKNWLAMKAAGIDLIPSNDFSFYDQVLDMTALLGAVPERYGWRGGREVDLDTVFAMARGVQEKEGVGKSATKASADLRPAVPAMEMTKWFDTNYHYIVPEFHKHQTFAIASEKPFREFREAMALGVRTRPVILGPVTYLTLGKLKKGGAGAALELLGPALETYVSILRKLESIGAKEIQIDEPALVLDLDAAQKNAIQKAYRVFAQKVPGVRLMLTTYFGALGPNLKLAASLPVAGLHVDLVRAPQELAAVVRAVPKEMSVSFGIVDGRNVWKNHLRGSVRFLKAAVAKLGPERSVIASSCSLAHSPLGLEQETAMDAETKSWLSFAKEKLNEVRLVRDVLARGEKGYLDELGRNERDVEGRRKSKRIHKKSVAARIAAVGSKDLRRGRPFGVRQALQRERLGLPAFPTTTIGSFPQTADVRRARAEFKKGALPADKYRDFLREKTRDAVRRQEAIGLDVLVHGEFERNDMVEYFGEQLGGFLFTQNGWVQSYGSRCVKPPVIYGDVERPRPMTVEWSVYTQSLTPKPVKGMLTGPITILQWSFVRDDQPRSLTARQIALAIRDEVRDLEKAGIRAIQIDEPALREGLPLRKKERAAYLRWAVDAFRLASSGVEDRTQIHTHMCYSEFNDIIRSIAAMDADVISIETSRSQMELLDAFAKFRYPNEIGPGVYDIHSPRVPSVGEITALLKKAAAVIPPKNLWVNPDCGLKTRGWEETTPSLKAMVQAARSIRQHSKKNTGAALCLK
ncbi:MAG: 5-methyltetrahydropteroyltriglutamate--homocysteine S-methyltransferase [Candidatus Omnitrophica bacterium]|nr:5-methyltetrahydropteroyltriglutamate--homocysteine S-methyltransferase [Candidatus Omnitrophota bacterium]